MPNEKEVARLWLQELLVRVEKEEVSACYQSIHKKDKVTVVIEFKPQAEGENEPEFS